MYNNLHFCPKSISENDKLINCTEELLKKQIKNLADCHLPEGNNKFLVFILSIFHSLSIMYTFFGIFLPSKYLIFYSLYLTLLLSSLLLHNNKCFLTLLKINISNYKKNPIHLKEKTSVFILCFLIILSLTGYVKPLLSMQNILLEIIKIINKYAYFISISALLLFIFFFAIYILSVIIKKKNELSKD